MLLSFGRTEFTCPRRRKFGQKSKSAVNDLFRGLPNAGRNRAAYSALSKPQVFLRRVTVDGSMNTYGEAGEKVAPRFARNINFSAAITAIN
jgi:hypothetical protein